MTSLWQSRASTVSMCSISGKHAALLLSYIFGTQYGTAGRGLTIGGMCFACIDAAWPEPLFIMSAVVCWRHCTSRQEEHLWQMT